MFSMNEMCLGNADIYTNSIIVKINTIDSTEFPKRSFSPGNGSIVVIFHGFKGSLDQEWVKKMAQALSGLRGKLAVALDWYKEAHYSYSEAVTSIEDLGDKLINQLMSFMRRHKLKPEMFHFIGYCLGAHIAGYIGHKIKGIHRITGLDPARPLFEKMSQHHRLDISDAKFVDVIHSDSGKFGNGIHDPIGHVDFYPNGGEKQPGSSDEFRALHKIHNELVFPTDMQSSHARAVDYFLESILSSPSSDSAGNCLFIGYLCDSYSEFLNGACITCGQDGMGCAIMGTDADLYAGKHKNDQRPKKFYMKTNNAQPYCGIHYRWDFKMTSQTKSRNSLQAYLSAEAFGDMGHTGKMYLTEGGGRQINDGTLHTFVGFSPLNAGHVTSAQVSCSSCNENLPFAEVSVTNFGHNQGKSFERSTVCPGMKFGQMMQNDSWIISLGC